jgi:glycosyltransferase EpsD
MKSKKKVLFSATVDSHILNFHIPYLKYFKDQGYEVHVATNGTEKIPYCDVKHTVSFERSPFKFNNLKAIRQLKKIIDIEKFEIIHTHTPMGSVITRLAARSSRKKIGTIVFYTAHGFHFYTGAPIQNWIIYYPVEKILAHITDVLVTINEEDYVRAQKKLRAKSTIKINGVGVDLKRFRPVKDQKEKDQLRREYGFDKDDLILICVAELNGNKNQGFLIKAMREVLKINPKAKLLLCGIGDYEERYRKLIIELDLEDNVLLMGYRKDIHKLMRMSDIGVSASIREGFGLSIVEELASGIPVAISKNRGHIEIIQEKYLGSFYPCDEIDEYISILQKTAIKKRNAQSAKRHNFASKFSIPNVMNFMTEHYIKELPNIGESLSKYSGSPVLQNALFPKIPKQTIPAKRITIRKSRRTSP